MSRTDHRVFTEHGPELAHDARARAIRQAHHAANEAQESFILTARRQYRRYRQAAGTEFMAWPEWHEHYLDYYRRPTVFQPDNG